MFVCLRSPLPSQKGLYQTLVQPHMDYSSVVWAECVQLDAKKLDCIQKSGMRLILGESRDCPSASMRFMLGWMIPRNRKRMMRMIV